MSGLFHGFGRNRIATAIGAIVVLLGLFILWNLSRSQSDPRLDAIRQRGQPVTLTELDAWYRAVPPADNAALVYIEALALPALSEPQPGSPGYSADGSRAFDIFTSTNAFPPRGKLLNPDAHRSLAEFFATNQAALTLLHSVRSSSPARYPINLNEGFNTPLVHLSGVKRLTSFLAAESMLHLADGDSEKTVESLLAAGRVADSLSEEPLLISELVRIACVSIVSARLERVLSVMPLTEDQLTRLEQMLQQIEKPQAYFRAMVGERANGLAVFTNRKYLNSAFTGMNPPPGRDENLRTAVLVGALKATGLFRKDRSFYLDVMATNIAAAQQPFPERIKASQAAAQLFASPNRLRIISNMLLPALSRAHIRDVDLAARIRAARTALALERYRRAHANALPESLNDLSPTYLPSVPTDPYDGQPLRYKPRDGGYVIYSIGSDGRDDGGIEPTSYSQTLRDITFIVAAPAP